MFELAVNILGVLSDGPAAIQMPFHAQGGEIAGWKATTLRQAVPQGRRKFTGAYYTSVPAATLLSRLVFHRMAGTWIGATTSSRHP